MPVRLHRCVPSRPGARVRHRVGGRGSALVLLGWVMWRWTPWTLRAVASVRDGPAVVCGDVVGDSEAGCLRGYGGEEGGWKYGVGRTRPYEEATVDDDVDATRNGCRFGAFMGVGVTA